MSKITVVVLPDGSSVLEVEGVKGPACKDLTRNLEKALGKSQIDHLKQEFYEPVEIQQEIRQ